MEEIKLSVIIPNFNNGKYIGECLDSIIKQSYKPYEIIIIDDCSTDGSKEVIESYVNDYKNVRAIFLDKNRGVSHARDIGIMNAKGNYITTIDSDDFYYNDNKLHNEIEVLKTYLSKGMDIISYSKTVTVDESAQLLKRDKYNKNKYKFFEGDIFLDLITRRYIRCVPRDYCMKKDIYFEAKGYDLDMDLYEDLDLLIRLSQKYNFYTSKNEGTAYRQHNLGLSKRDNKSHRQVINQIQKKYKHSLVWYKRIYCNMAIYMVNLKNCIINILHTIKNNLRNI